MFGLMREPCVAYDLALISRDVYLRLSPFSTLTAISQCGVAGGAETFPCIPVSGPFLSDLPGFHVSSGSVLPSQPGSSCRALPSIFISATALMWSVSSLLLRARTIMHAYIDDEMSNSDNFVSQ